MVKCCLVIKDGGKVNPSSEQEATTSPGKGELLEQMPPVLPISSQVMGEDRKIRFPVVLAWCQECQSRWLLKFWKLRLPIYRGKELLLEHKMFRPAENADITELLIKASKQKVALTAGFRREENWSEAIK